MRDNGRRTFALSGAVLAAGILLLVGGMVLAGSGPFSGSAQPTAPDTPTTEASGAGTDGTAASGANEVNGANGTAENGSSDATATSVGVPDGNPLSGTRSLADSAVTIEGVDGDEVGFATAMGDVNGDGVADLVVGAPYRNASGTRSGAAEVFFGPVDAGDLRASDADVTLVGVNRGDWAGNSVAVADVNGDGTGDLVVGAPRTDPTGANAGTAYVVYGGADLGGEVPLDAADRSVSGTTPGAHTGYSVAAADVIGDGAADLVVAAPRADDGRGEVYVLDGTRLESETPVTAADATFVGEGADDTAGSSIAVAENVTGEGPEIVVGAQENDAAGDDAGAVYVLAAPFEDRSSLGDADLVLRGTEAGAYAGWSVAAPGDVSGDGSPDVVVGAPLMDPAGAAYVADGGTGERSLADAVALRGAESGDRAGWSVTGAGDLTCNGATDLLVGAPEHDAGGDNAGAYHVVAGATDDGTGLGRPISLENATATLVGADPGDQAGRVNDVGVVSLENRTGLVLGAPFGAPPQTAHVVGVTCPSG